MSYYETYNILNKVWLTSKDIQKLVNCGKDTARKIRDKVAEKTLAKGYALPLCKNKVVSTKEVIEYLGLDIKYIIEMATLEQNNKIGLK